MTHEIQWVTNLSCSCGWCSSSQKGFANMDRITMWQLSATTLICWTLYLQPTFSRQNQQNRPEKQTLCKIKPSRQLSTSGLPNEPSNSDPKRAQIHCKTRKKEAQPLKAKYRVNQTNCICLENILRVRQQSKQVMHCGIRLMGVHLSVHASVHWPKEYSLDKEENRGDMKSTYSRLGNRQRATIVAGWYS